MRTRLFLLMLLFASLLNAKTTKLNDVGILIEYQTTEKNDRPHAPLRFQAYVEEINGVLQLGFLGNFSDVDITITDADGIVAYQETNGTIYDGKVINITPADGYPYDVVITSSSLNIIGVISQE